jgi:hypothetical protein
MTKNFLSKHFEFRFICALGALMVVAFAMPVWAQIGTGTISGTVTDSSGGAIVGSAVQITNVDRNIVRSTVTDSQGRYRMSDLPIGNYEVQASVAAFQTSIQKGIKLTVGSHPVVDVTLPAGQTSQTITVMAEATQVETQTSAIYTLVTSEQMEELPLNGRNFSQLITLAPGVQAVPPNPGVAGTAFYGAQENYSIAGARPEGQAFLLDNTDMVNFWNHAVGSSGTGYSLGVEAVAEFQLLTNTYGAQFGGAGAVVNAATKSGTNKIHGSAYEFFRNSVLDARDYFHPRNSDGTPGEKSPYRRNQFGASLGGPIIKDKLFFFGNYEASRESLALRMGTSVPQPYVAQGKLPCSTMRAPLPTGCPATPSGNPGSVNNPIVNVPGALAVSKAIAALFPAPLTTNPDLGGYATYNGVADQVINADYALGRIDYNIGNNDSIFWRYIFDKGQRTDPFPAAFTVPGWPSLADSKNQFFTTEERHVFSARMINLVRFAFIRTNERAHTSSPQVANSPMQFYPGRPDGLLNIQGMWIGGNQALPYYIVQNKFAFADDFAWSLGAHNLKAGVQVTRVQTNLSAPFELGGNYTFSTIQDFLQGSPLTFLGVYPGQTDATRDFREIDIAPYVQDDWKITSRLTLNAGLRWEFATNAVGVRHPLNNILNPPTGKFVSVEHVFASNPNLKNLDPRIGIAFDPFKDHKTSIRGGFGIFHNRVAPRTYASGYYFSPPFANVFNAVFIPPYSVPFPNPFPPPLNPPGTGPITQFAGVYYQIDKSPYQMQYNFSIQREIARNTVLSVGYVGGQGRNLFTQNDVNPSQCNTPGTAPGSTPTTNCSAASANFAASVNPNTPNPRINASNNSMFTVLGNSSSNYNSLQVSLNRQLVQNFAAQLSYTWGKCLDNGSVTSGLEQFSFPRADPYNVDYDYGRCSYDIRHSLVQNSVISLPFKGNKFVEGWQISEILNVSSGMPVNVLAGFDNTGLGAAITSARPNFSGSSKCSLGKIDVPASPAAAPGAIQWFDPTCYSVNPFGTLGNVPRNSVNGPGIFQLDATVKKSTKLSEGVSTEFRAEFFNIINHPMFNPPAAGIFTDANNRNPMAGQITQTSRRPRQIQFALKFVF